VDRRFKKLCPLEAAVALMQRPPAIERAGRGDGDGAELGDHAVDGPLCVAVLARKRRSLRRPEEAIEETCGDALESPLINP
jgi:hypothetical protein